MHNNLLIKQNNYKKILSILFFILLFIIFVAKWPVTTTHIDNYNYMILLFAETFFSAFIIRILFRKDFYFFEPITIITALSFLIFVIRPLIDIQNGEMICFGVDVRSGCIKTTLIVMISYLIFYTFYYSKKNKKTYRHIINHKLSKINKNKLVLVSKIIWFVCFVLIIIYFVLSGKGVSSIFTFKFEENYSNTSNNVAFLTNFAYSMFIPVIIILFYGNNRLTAITMYVLTLLVFLALSFRFPIVILMVAPIVYKYIKKRETPSISLIILGLAALLLMAAMVGFLRVGMRFGKETDWSSFDIRDITYVFDSDLTVYKPIYRIVKLWPSQYSYYFGKEMILQTIFLIIPRAIWPLKPEPIAREIILLSLNERAVVSGQAYAVIGQFYVEFGIIGCLIICSLAGFFCGKLKDFYSSNNILIMILYSVLWPTLMQLFIRNYVPSAVFLILFEILPLIFLNLSIKKCDNIS